MAGAAAHPCALVAHELADGALFERVACGKRSSGAQAATSDARRLVRALRRIAARCARARTAAAPPPSARAGAVEVDDARVRACARFLRARALRPYARCLHLVPRVVNVVTLAQAQPVVGTGTSLPLDLHAIVARCTSAYYAPKRFAAVQLAYSNPRSRVLLFHTGRVVGTGCQGAVAARVAIARAQEQLAREAGVHVRIESVTVINSVGAASLGATVSCEAFAQAHQGTSHFDHSSFVGLAWRPAHERCCCEVYSTGRANLPGARTERDLLASFRRMLPELLRYSSAHALADELDADERAAAAEGGRSDASSARDGPPS
jgi:TATA-box binding protein (TBP) (component of TFIID and TFIIIB)